MFKYLALPFGLSTSCKIFDSLISALMGFWRRCESGGRPTRASSYIDDIVGVNRKFKDALLLSIRMVFEAAALGLSLKIRKCSYFPRHAMVTVGTVVDLTNFEFRVSRKRVKKIMSTITRLQTAIVDNPLAVPAKVIASMIGLISSISCCCQRAAGVMTRSIIAVLSRSMKTVIRRTERPLKAILTAFWSGTVKWDTAAQRQLNFWQSVNFASLRAPVSADVLGRAIELTFKYPSYLSDKDISILVQDASGTAAGGGMVYKVGNDLKTSERVFLYVFSNKERDASSTLREIMGILRCLRATEGCSKVRIIFACDNAQTVNAIKFGSRTVSIQQIAEEIFAWSLRTNKVCWPIWLPRDHRFIKEADLGAGW